MYIIFSYLAERDQGQSTPHERMAWTVSRACSMNDNDDERNLLPSLPNASPTFAKPAAVVGLRGQKGVPLSRPMSYANDLVRPMIPPGICRC